MNRRFSCQEAADDLRDQAQSYRTLADRARTPEGATALRSVAKMLDGDARRIHPGLDGQP